MAIRELSVWQCFTAAAVVGKSSLLVFPPPPLCPQPYVAATIPVHWVWVHKPIAGWGGEEEFQREKEREATVCGLRGRAEGPRGEILTPATMGGEQRRATVTEIIDENGRERETGLTLIQGLERGERAFEQVRRGNYARGRRGTNSHIHTYMFTHINHCQYQSHYRTRVSHLCWMHKGPHLPRVTQRAHVTATQTHHLAHNLSNWLHWTESLLRS